MRRFVITALAVFAAGCMLAACGNSGDGTVSARTGLVIGTLELDGGNPRSNPMPVNGRVCFFPRDNSSRLGETCTTVGNSGHFSLHLHAGNWQARGSSPHYVINGKRGSCTAVDIPVLAGLANTNVVVSCSVL